jgi:hypothetical protein
VEQARAAISSSSGWSLVSQCYGFAFGGSCLMSVVFGAIRGKHLRSESTGALGADESIDCVVGGSREDSWTAGTASSARFANGFSTIRRFAVVIHRTAYLTGPRCAHRRACPSRWNERVWVWVVVGIVVAGIVAALAIPAYQDYVNKARACSR